MKKPSPRKRDILFLGIPQRASDSIYGREIGHRVCRIQRSPRFIIIHDRGHGAERLNDSVFFSFFSLFSTRRLVAAVPRATSRATLCWLDVPGG